MPVVVTVSETHRDGSAFAAALSFDHGTPYTCQVKDPFTTEEEANLEWYFEQHLRFPFVETVRAQQAAESVRAYGERLFGMVFENRDAYAEYKQYLAQGAEQLRFVIAGSPEFHALHWEALRDPALPQPFSVSGTMIRQSLTPAAVRAMPKPQATINVMVVTARPGGGRDVGYRTISRPLIESLRQANLPVKVDFVRPGTYRALSDALQAATVVHGAGYYHVVHFDTHGALMTFSAVQQMVQVQSLLSSDRYERYGRDTLQTYEDERAFIFLERERVDAHDPVEAGELADMLMLHQVPVVILNACQSAKQQAGARETSLGSRLMHAGARVTLAMSYSVTVSAAEKMMRALYARLFEGADLSESIRRARLELLNDKRRRAYFNQTIALEDWLLLVVYQNQPVQLQLSATSPMLNADLPAGVPRAEFPQPAYGFFGRDLDILNIERRMLRDGGSNVLLVRGMGGVGKTTLLRHLAAWWQRTGLAQHVFYFGYDERAWTRQQLLDWIGRQLLGDAEFERLLQTRPLDEQQAELTRRLRAARHLLILDNCESITGEHLAIQHTLPEAERGALRRLLDDLRGGKTLVLLGSRAAEVWLLPEHERHDLRGLDGEAASDLAEVVLKRHGASQYRDDPDLDRLLKLLDGYPLAIQVILENLKRQTPAEVLAALQAGNVNLDASAADKTESILKCVDYSHSNLDAEAQQLLLCLAPFTSVLWLDIEESYAKLLKAQPALANLPFERLGEVRQAATDWGLLAPHPQSQRHVQLQPVLAYFLRAQMQAHPEMRAAIEAAFRTLFDQVGGALFQLTESKDAQEKQVGLAVIGLEYENLHTALFLALAVRASILDSYRALSNYLDAQQDYVRGLELDRTLLAHLNDYPPEALAGQLGVEFVAILDDFAKRQLQLKRWDEAKATYQKVLSLASKLDQKELAQFKGEAYHQLGAVAQEQRQWAEAEAAYRQALTIYVECNDRYYQAHTHHNLGMMAQEQRNWTEAEAACRQALEIFAEFNDRRNQAHTYLVLGGVALGQQQWAKASTALKQSQILYMEFEEHYHEGHIYFGLGIVAHEQRQWAEAEAEYRKALEIFVEFNDRYHQARTYLRLGAVAQERQQRAEAEAAFRQALTIFAEFNDRYNQASVYHNLGVLAQEQRRWVEAEAAYRQALAIFGEYDDRRNQANSYHGLGAVVQAQRQWAEAETAYLRALAIFDEFNDLYEQAKAYYQLGALAEEQRQWAKAEAAYRQALAIKIMFNDRYDQANTYYQLGIVTQKQRQWAKAEVAYRQALAIFVEFDDRNEQASTYHQLGMMAQEQRRWAKAEAAYRKALAIFEESDDRHNQASTYHQLGRVAEERRQWTEALESFMLAINIFVDAKDDYSLSVVLSSITRIRHTCGDAVLAASIAPTVAQAMGISEAQAVERLAQSD